LLGDITSAVRNKHKREARTERHGKIDSQGLSLLCACTTGQRGRLIADLDLVRQDNRRSRHLSDFIAQASNAQAGIEILYSSFLDALS
jgi:hypothetical protein